MLTKEQKAMFKRILKEFLWHFVTSVHHYTLEMKERLKELISPGKAAPEKAKTVRSIRGSIMLIYWPDSMLN